MRNRTAGIAAVMLMTVGAAWALQSVPMKMEAPEHFPREVIRLKRNLTPEQRIAHYIKVLGLEGEARAKAEALASDKGESRPDLKEIDVQELQEFLAEIDVAKKAGDEAKVKELEKQLQDRMQVKKPSESTIEQQFRALLTPGQVPLFERAKARLDREPTGTLRPIDLLSALEVVELDDSQAKDVAARINALRQRFSGSRINSAAVRWQQLNLVYDQIATLLNDEQRAAYDAEVDRWRVDDIPGTEPKRDLETRADDNLEQKAEKQKKIKAIEKKLGGG